MDRFALRRDDAAAVNAQAVLLADEAEFDRVPVQPRELLQRVRADAVRLDAALAVGLHVIGEHRVHQQRHVAEQVVEEIGLFDVVDLVGTTDPPRHREAAVGEVVEEVEFGQQALDADQRPASRFAEHGIEVVELRNAVGRHAHRVLRLQELVTGAALQDLALARIQRRPGRVVLGAVAVPRLLDDAGRVHRHLALVGLQVLDAARGRGGDIHGQAPWMR
jgi:hypothetical protein